MFPRQCVVLHQTILYKCLYFYISLTRLLTRMVCLYLLTWLPYGAAFAAWIAFTQKVISFEVADFDVKS